MTSVAPLQIPPALLALLGNRPVRWKELGMPPNEFLAACERHELRGLLYSRISRLPDRDEWPRPVRDGLGSFALLETALELVRRHEIVGVLRAMSEAGIQPLLLKGAALAYTVYEAPAYRPRNDTDLLIREADVASARTVLADRGYRATVHCSDLFSQFEVQRDDALGLRHVFDVHWKISTQPVFADVFTYDDLSSRAQRVPALGAHALTAGAGDALLLACIHPVMHHRNDQRALWLYDIHLLAGRLSGEDFDELARRARDKRVAAICARQLQLAQTMFNTSVPQRVVNVLSAVGTSEPSAEYLAQGRRWHNELLSGVKALPTLRDRARLLRGVLFPSPRYMLDVYGLGGKPLGAILLPVLYVHRNVNGAWKILTGQK